MTLQIERGHPVSEQCPKDSAGYISRLFPGEVCRRAAPRPGGGLLQSDAEGLDRSLDQIAPRQPVLYSLAGAPGV